MPPDSNAPGFKQNVRSVAVPPPLSPQGTRKFGSLRHWFALLLSVCLGLFILEGVVSVVDDALVLGRGLHLFSAFRGICSLLIGLMAIGIYGLIGLTPMVPKRLFLPIPLFVLASLLAMLPVAIYWFGLIQEVDLDLAIGQVILGLILIRRAQGGRQWRWLLVAAGQLGVRRFSWRHLAGFVLANLFLLLPAVIAYLAVCASLAVDHFSEGFMALRPDGLTVQVRKYVRTDGKVIELFPMSHVADAGFYRQVSQAFPTNSIILMEGVTDNQNLLTNGISYQRMAKSLGLAEQHVQFAPDRGERVRADVDVDQFSPDTIGLLNLVMRLHAEGVNFENLRQLMAYAPSPQFEEKVIDDVLTKRNQHLVVEIRSHLARTDHLMVPWGVAHMPGIAREIQKSGFLLVESHEYFVIRFAAAPKTHQAAKP